MDSKPGAPEKGRQSASARSTPTVPDGIRARERYCVLVRVTRDALGLSERDIRIPSHLWEELIAKDICESRIGCPPDTFKVQLLSDTEFLLWKVPTSGPVLSWEEATAVIRLVSGGVPLMWCTHISSPRTPYQEGGKVRPPSNIWLPACPG